MTGIQIEINKRKINNLSPLLEPISVSGIASLLGLCYNGAKNKIKENTFTVEEGIKILETFFRVNDKYDSLKYLFTEQGE